MASCDAQQQSIIVEVVFLLASFIAERPLQTEAKTTATKGVEVKIGTIEKKNIDED